MKTGTDLINEAKARITEVTAADVEALLAEGKRAVLLDDTRFGFVDEIGSGFHCRQVRYGEVIR